MTNKLARLMALSVLCMAADEAASGAGGGTPGGNDTKASGKKKAEVTMVKMEDGREVGFAGKRKINKETLIDEGKIALDNDTVTIQDGAVTIRMDFRNGATRLFPIKAAMLAKFAGHGGEQKYGDELASPADKPLSEDDMVLAVEELHDQLYNKGEWRATSEGGFGGASVVVKAIMEASGKTMEEVKKFLDGKLEAAKAKGEKLSRRDLYDSFRNPNSKVGQIVERLEKERLAKDSKVDADAALNELGVAEAASA